MAERTQHNVAFYAHCLYCVLLQASPCNLYGEQSGNGAGISPGKGKAVPLQAWSGPEGSRNLRFPDFMTTAQERGKVVSLTHRAPVAFTPLNPPGNHFC